LDAVTDETGQYLRSLLDAEPGSAAALMDPRVLPLDPGMTVEQALALLRARRFQRGNTQARRIMLLVDAQQRLLGMVAIQDLVLAAPEDSLQDYQQAVPATVLPKASREEIVEVLEAQQVSSLPVVDEQQRLLGIV